MFVLIYNYQKYGNLLHRWGYVTVAEFRKSYKDIRAAYNDRKNLMLEQKLPVKCPFYLFDKWFKDVKGSTDLIEPTAMCLATATKNGMPSARYVLCKGYDKSGFIFYTHYTSRKGQELEENPNAALTFYWAALHRSVRIEGTVEKLPPSDADIYFQSRPYDSQIGTLSSDQSKPIDGREFLTDKEKELKEKYKEGFVPRPELWGGYKVAPRTIEFWQGQTDRIHDRLRFRKPKPGEVADNKLSYEAEDGWIIERLSP